MLDAPLDTGLDAGPGTPLAWPRGRGHWSRWPREVALLALLYVAYAWIRDAHGRATDDSSDQRTAFAHGHAVGHLEQVLHLDPERALQAPLLGHLDLIHVVNGIYLVAHISVTLAVLAFLLQRRPAIYARCRTALVTVTALSLAAFALYPTAPPRLLPGSGIHDTLTVGGWWSLDHGGIERIADPYAAMPSLHLGWSTWVALSLAAACAPGARRLLFAAYPILVLGVVLVTGAHWLLDGVAGSALSLVCWWATGVGTRAVRRRSPG